MLKGKKVSSLMRYVEDIPQSEGLQINMDEIKAKISDQNVWGKFESKIPYQQVTEKYVFFKKN